MKLITFLIIAWLPGAAIFRAPFASRDKRASLDAEERLFWSVIISVAISLVVALALAAAHRYSFQRLLAADIGIAAIVALASRLRLRLGPQAKYPGLSVLLPLSLVVLGLLRFFPSSEYVIGGKDPGIYVNTGIQIAQRGTFLYRDPVVSSVPSFARDLFFPSHKRHDYYSLRFMGLRILDPDAGTTVSQFPHLFSVSIAIGYGVDGLTGARRTVGVWAILGVLALYFAGARLLGRPAAWVGAALLSLHVVQVWFARYPNAEVVMQALLLAALLAFARSHVDDDGFFAPVAGALLGLLVFLRFDAVLGIAAVLAALALMVLAGTTRVRAWFVVPLGIGAALSVPYLLGPMRAYAEYPIIFFNSFTWWQHLLLVMGAVVGLSALFVGARLPRLGEWIQAWVPRILMIVIPSAALYALYLRAPIPRVLAEHDAYALRTFAAFYLTLPGLLAAILGYALFVRRVFWRAPEVFTTIAVFSLFFFYKIRISPEHFWMSRRFLPVILPGALLFAAAAALGGVRGGWAPTRLLRASVGLVFISLLALQYARAARPVLPHVEYQGVIARLEHLAAQIGDRDLLIVEPGGASDTHVLAVPLAYIYSRNALLLSSQLPDKEVFARFLDWARTQYDRVLFIGGGGTSLLSPAWGTRTMASDRFQLPEYETPVNAYPRFVRQKEFDYSVYELTPPDPEAASTPFDLDVGVNDDLHVVRFHAKERTEGRTFRWSRNRSLVSISHLGGGHALVLTMSDGGRPAAAPPADVTVTLEKEVLGTVRVDTAFKPYTLESPPALAERLRPLGRALELTITTSVWKPSSVLGTPDDRDVGIMLDRVTVR